MKTYMIDARIQVEVVDEEDGIVVADALAPKIEALPTVRAVYVDDVRPITGPVCNCGDVLRFGACPVHGEKP